MCVWLCVFANTTIISLPVCLSVCMSQHLLLSAACVYMFLCVCLCVSVSEHNLCLWICAPLNSSPCHSVCPLFHKPVCLLSGVRWHIMFPYLSVYLSPFLSFIQLFCPGIPAIMAFSLQGLYASCRVISELMLPFLYHPHDCDYDCLLGKNRISSLFSCQKSQGIAW